jgi:tripartite-type tricarboxylate transporter receptor subunit TctC
MTDKGEQMRISRGLPIMLVAVLCAVPLAARAQAWPAKPIRVVVPYAPGAIDVYVRMIAPRLQEDLGQPIIVDNKPGATGFIGAEHVAKSAPDGYTMMATPAGSVVVAFTVASNPPFNTLRDFAPVTMIYDSPQAIVVKAALPVNTLREFIEYAKRNPGKLSYGSTGIGGAQHVDAETFKRFTETDIVHVPYNGFAPVIQALLGGQVDMASATIGIVKQHVVSGKMKLIASHNGKVSSDLPAVPVLNDLYAGFETSPAFVGLWVPAGVPRPVIQRLNAVSVKALREPQVRGKIEEGGAVVGANTPEEFLAIIHAGLEATARNIKAARAAGAKFE